MQTQQDVMNQALEQDWFRDRPELKAIFEEFIKIPPKIDLNKPSKILNDELKIQPNAENQTGEQLERNIPEISQTAIQNEDHSLIISNQRQHEISHNKKQNKPKIRNKKKVKKLQKQSISSDGMDNITNQSISVSDNTAKVDTLQPRSKKKDIQKRKKQSSKSNEEQKTKKKKIEKEPEKPVVRDLCKFFLSGHCYKGDLCPFLHDKKLFPCKFYHLYNSCKKGELCEYSHQTPLSEEYRQLLINTEKKKEIPQDQKPTNILQQPVLPFIETNPSDDHSINTGYDPFVGGTFQNHVQPLAASSDAPILPFNLPNQ
ncbi:hypothetical protein FDP41_003476 [Naegleria fowleri]|uniref:C3H1-type domain-containing protein n=1 Tax=Naegleria fowleri TaxID=5763 RepID=A0A6A5BTC8_NAEFO|nr:uncharacterized protein FDP41_003476 [Naegleria fowleri]KAF0977484.1 hypothetical protein FDP41_003476 [Naegleria fowleri]CAG4709224.1 unnamed protein product [Naegleria fowleri]